MTRDWSRLGAYLKAAREGKKITQVQLAELAGLSEGTVQAVEGGKRFARVTPSIRTMARAVGWTEGSPDAVLDGGEPTLAPPHQGAERGQSSGAGVQLPPGIQAELDEGQFLDGGVFDLTEGPDVQLIVIVKGPGGASSSDVRRYMEKWRKERRRLQRLGDDSSDTEGDD
ncbi:helix-turn-helix domain-containing protein [Streptomyces sp. NPDC050509]|uniref:helix-turn-helix domain-containing protein n=1 Tax=Streptomyces sp. NPDC050509 TaxID=3365620 RepID=UPI0037AFD7F3